MSLTTYAPKAVYSVHDNSLGYALTMDVKKRYSEGQIIGFLKEVDAGIPVKELCRKHGTMYVSLARLLKPR